MTAVVWMRHGTSDYGWCRPSAHARLGSPLTLAGMVETELTTQRLAERQWKPALVVSSQLRRAHQTASIVARALETHLAPPVAMFTEWQAPHCVLGRSPADYPPQAPHLAKPPGPPAGLHPPRR